MHQRRESRREEKSGQDPSAVASVANDRGRRRGAEQDADAPSLGSALVSAVASAVRRPRVAFSLTTWALLVAIAVFAPAPYTPPPEALEARQASRESVESFYRSEYEEALFSRDLAMEERDGVKVWFWRLRGVDPNLVQSLDERVASSLERLAAASAELDARKSVGDRAVGVWSEYSIAETREAFERARSGSVAMAKRMSTHDLFWSIFTTRTESVGDFFGLILSVLFKMLMNFLITSIFALFSFMSSAWSIAASFGGGLTLSSVAFFGLVTACAAAMLALYFSLVTTVVVGVPTVAFSAFVTPALRRLEEQRRAEGRAQYIRHQQYQQQYGRQHHHPHQM